MKAMHLQTSRLIPIGAATALLFSGFSVAAAEADQSAWTGVWTYMGDAGEQRQRQEAIETVTKSLPSFVRSKARKKLEERMQPPPELSLKVEGGNVELSRGGGKTMSLRIGAEPVTVEKDGKQAKASARIEGDKLIILTDGDKGQRRASYALSPDKNRLKVSVQMKGKRLSEPLAFHSTYLRK